MPVFYEIRVEGHIDPNWSDWFLGLTLTPLESGETLIKGTLEDQAALHGLLRRIRDFNLTLISINSNPIIES